MYDSLERDPARISLNERADCAVRAVAHATGTTYSNALVTLAECGRRPRRSTPIHVTEQAIKRLGYELQDVTNEYRGRTVRTLTRELEPHLTFLVRVRRHVLCVRGGKALDWAAERLKRVVSILRVNPIPNRSLMMSDATTTAEPQTAEAPATPAEKPARKTTTKKAAPKGTKGVKKGAKKAAKGTKKAATKKAAKASTNGRPKAGQDVLCKPQVRILAVLAKNSKGLTRSAIAEKAEVDNAFCTTWIGSLNDEKRTANEAKRGIKSLITLKAVRPEEHDVGGKDTVLYFITATGQKLLEKSKAE